MRGEGESKKMRGYNRIRRGIRRFFPSRRCFVLPLPTANSAALAHVDRLGDSELAPSFVAAVRRLSDFVLSLTSGRVIAGRPVDGSSTSYCSLLHSRYFAAVAQRFHYDCLAQCVTAERVAHSTKSQRMTVLPQRPLERMVSMEVYF